MQNSSITWSWKSSNDGSVICNCQYVIVSQINTISDKKCSTTEQVTLRVMRCVGSVTKKQVSLKLKKKITRRIVRKYDFLYKICKSKFKLYSVCI